jgi:hypothetical protein
VPGRERAALAGSLECRPANISAGGRPGLLKSHVGAAGPSGGLTSAERGEGEFEPTHSGQCCPPARPLSLGSRFACMRVCDLCDRLGPAASEPPNGDRRARVNGGGSFSLCQQCPLAALDPNLRSNRNSAADKAGPSVHTVRAWRPLWRAQQSETPGSRPIDRLYR